MRTWNYEKMYFDMRSKWTSFEKFMEPYGKAAAQAKRM